MASRLPRTRFRVGAMWCAIFVGLEGTASRAILQHQPVCPAHSDSHLLDHAAPHIFHPFPFPFPAPRFALKGHATIATGEAKRNPWSVWHSNEPAPKERTRPCKDFAQYARNVDSLAPPGTIRIFALSRRAVVRFTCGYVRKPLRGTSGHTNARSMPDQRAINTPLRALREHVLCAMHMGLRTCL
jgi:hypothetical protein